MTYFSRLSDIISCKLEDLLADSPEPVAAIERIVSEIEEGLAGARRSVHSAASAEQRLTTDLVERQGQVTFWARQAREQLAVGNEDGARQSLMRKRETEDLVAGLEQQLAAATSTREHLSTTLRAIEARLAEAQRRQSELHDPQAAAAIQRPISDVELEKDVSFRDRTRDARIEEELDALRRELRGAK